MARAGGIWVVYLNDGLPVLLVGAFTVKHELVTWLKRQEPADLEDMKVNKLQDGDPRYAVVELSIEELIA